MWEQRTTVNISTDVEIIKGGVCVNTKGNSAVCTDKAENKRSVSGASQGKRKIGEITVSEICRRADIHRTTFYGHFDDVYDLMQNMVEEMCVQLMDFFCG